MDSQLNLGKVGQDRQAVCPPETKHNLNHCQTAFAKMCGKTEPRRPSFHETTTQYSKIAKASVESSAAFIQRACVNKGVAVLRESDNLIL